MREYYKDIAIHFGGDYAKMDKAIQNRVEVPSYESTYPYICKGDDEYPIALYDLKYPPYVLFYEGNIDLLSKPMVSVVGSRNPSKYGIDSTNMLVRHLREKYCIVSGLAKGIDGIAHKNALDFSTVGVLGCGIDVVYPSVNRPLFDTMRRTQCIISEYPPGVKPKRHHFPFRNRIVVALGTRLYVMGAAMRSGTMTSVNEALEINRHVICLPYPLYDKTGVGCNVLIKEGADILTSYDLI